MKFPGAPYGLKMACGENPKRVYAEKGPSTRMGNVAGYRRRSPTPRSTSTSGRSDAEKGEDQPKRDLKLETLADVLAGKILVHNHCYRADEMAQMLDLAQSSASRSARSTTRSRRTRSPTCWRGTASAASVWADWWGFKMEALDGIPRERGADHAGRRPRDHALRLGGRHPATQPGRGEGDVGREPRRHPRHSRAGDPLDHRQSGLGARHRLEHRHARDRQGGRRRALVGRPVLGLQQGR